jgi:hypothetical protein
MLTARCRRPRQEHHSHPALPRVQCKAARFGRSELDTVAANSVHVEIAVMITLGGFLYRNIKFTIFDAT